MEGDEGLWRVYLNCSNDSIHSYPVYSNGLITAGKVLTTTTSVLSILGCSLIIFSYLAYKDLRTKARAMLCHLSVADLIIVTSHVAGFYENFSRYLLNPDLIPDSNEDSLCVSQAAFLVFGSIASLMWSNAVGIFMVVLAVNSKQKERVNQTVYLISCVACWIVPLAITIIIAALKLYGFVIVGATSCYIINYTAHNITTIDYQIAEFFSYELWLYLSFLLLPFLYSIVFYHTQCKLKKTFVVLSSQGHGGPPRNVPEFKYLLVPTIFIFLRIWGAIIEIFVYFSGQMSSYGCSRLAAGIALVDGVCINAQGLANAIFFCLLTKSVRKNLKRTGSRLCRRLFSLRRWRQSQLLEEMEPSHDSKEGMHLSDTFESSMNKYESM